MNNFKIEEIISRYRKNIIEWYPIRQDESVLVVGNQGEEISEYFKNKTSIVESYDFEGENKFGMKYDLIFVDDFYSVCEKMSMSIGDEIDAVYNTIKNILKMKSQDGIIFLAMENKLGMKYWAGCQEERRGGLFAGIEGQVDRDDGVVLALSKNELEKILKNIDEVENYKFYYPYPDYKYPLMIFTDEFLPQIDTLNRNIRNIDKDRLVLFDEKDAFNSVIKARCFPEFSNSYMIALK